MTTWIDAAIAELKKAGQPLHYSVITSKALASRQIKSEGKTPEQTMLSCITQSIKKGEKIFLRTSRGIYGLLEHRKGTLADKTRQDESTSNDKGTAGEHLVMAQLSLRGLHVYVPKVDTGVDMLCFKNDALSPRFIQVKTSTKKNNNYKFSIGIKSYRKNKCKNLFFIFVLLDEDYNEPQFVIMPMEKIKPYLHKSKAYRTISKCKREKYYPVTIYEKQIKGSVRFEWQKKSINVNVWGDIMDEIQ